MYEREPEEGIILWCSVGNVEIFGVQHCGRIPMGELAGVCVMFCV
jgi:hypothetical protein